MKPGKENIETKVYSSASINNFIPVSYTHLDVYKRQPWNTIKSLYYQRILNKLLPSILIPTSPSTKTYVFQLRIKRGQRENVTRSVTRLVAFIANYYNYHNKTLVLVYENVFNFML